MTLRYPCVKILDIDVELINDKLNRNIRITI